MKPIAKSVNQESVVVFSSAWATRKLTTVPEVPTIANFMNWRTPRLRNPVPIGEEHGEEPEQRQRKGEDHVVYPRTLAPARQNGEHRKEHERETRHGHQV